MLLPVVLVMSVVASVAHARPAAVIFPSSGRLPPDPNLWVASPGEPKIAITSGARPVPFRVDTTVFLADGMRWVAVYPEIRSGTLTVTIGRTQARFTIDPSLARRDLAVEDARSGDESVQFERMAIERADTLTIEARAPRGTVLYFLNHDVPEDDPYRWVWVGPGQAAGGSTRFELPLARFGMSCSGTRSITLSLYSSGLDSGATLYPMAELAVDRGRVKLPVEHLLQDEASKRWLPCPGASVRAGDKPPAEPESIFSPTRCGLSAGRVPPVARPVPHAPISAGEPSEFGSRSTCGLACSHLSVRPTGEPSELGSRPTSWSWWWSGVLAIAAALGVALLRRLPAHGPM